MAIALKQHRKKARSGDAISQTAPIMCLRALNPRRNHNADIQTIDHFNKLLIVIPDRARREVIRNPDSSAGHPLDSGLAPE